MKIPLSWLNQYLSVPLTVVQIENALTLAGIEVDKVEKTADTFSGIIVAKISSVTPHPEAERLQIATVFDGKESHQVVCGALNCSEGMKTAFAPIGASLTGDDGKAWKIKKCKLRSVDSFGMLCTPKELGLSDKEDGHLMICSHDIPEGTDISSLYSDYIFHISLTPNLGHCMSVLGIARELSAIFDIPLREQSFPVEENLSLPIEDMIEVSIGDSEGCMRYGCRLVQGITVGPSPEKVKRYVEACGMKSINNVVDIANLVMLETGQPLHIFDYDTLIEKKISVVSNLEASFFGLDQIERKIPKGTLVIAEGKRPLAIAGILGSLDSSVSETTKNILIEAASFSSSIIRKAMKQQGLRTEAGQRFEKGTDLEAVPSALDHATSLIQKFAGGKAAKGILDKFAFVKPQPEIRVRTSHVNKILGTQLATNEISQILQRLDIAILQELKDLLVTQPPSYRNDLNVEIDMVEEVARIYGYNNIPKKIPFHVSSPITHAPMYELEKKTRSKLLQEGLQECITCDLISPKLESLCTEKSLRESTVIHVLHPSSIDQSVLRTSLLPGLLQAVKLNQDHQTEDLSIFEVGRIHFKQNDQFVEQSVAGILLVGHITPYHWDPKPREVDFFDLKGMVENVMTSMGMSDFSFEPSHLESFHPFRQAKIKYKDITLGVIGEVHPAHRKILDLKNHVYFAEINLQTLMPLLPKENFFQPFSIYPGTERDWTISLPKQISFASLLEQISSIPSKLLEKVSLVDIYSSHELGDKKNVTFRFFYRETEKTIAFETAEKEHHRIVSLATEKIALLNKTTFVT